MFKSTKLRGILLFVLGLIAGLLLPLIQTNPNTSTLPEWAIALPSDIKTAKKVFDNNIKEKFPVGSEENLLLEELKTSGFIRNWWSPHNFNWATHITKDTICHKTRRIVWQKNENNKITKITGSYELTCL